MRFIEAMELGGMVVQPKPGFMMNTADQAGCALGMAVNARGCDWSDQEPRQDGETEVEFRRRTRTANMELFWPWMAHSVVLPCKCYEHRSSRSDQAKVVIAHLFDEHVFGAKDWTRERFMEFVKSIEPPEWVSFDILQDETQNTEPFRIGA